MSLDVYLTNEDETTERCVCSRCGHEHTQTYRGELYSSNITHNLTAMANAAGIYGALWRPDENGLTHAKQLIPLLRAGLDKLIADPKKYEAYDAPNGWGLYKHFVPFVKAYLAACEQFPEARVEVSR